MGKGSFKSSRIAIAISSFVLALILLSIETYTDFGYICENTGSRKEYRKWVFGWETNHWHEESPIERFMKKNYPDDLEYRWTSYRGTSKNIFGCVMVHAHGRPGPISRLKPEILEKYMNSLSDAEKKELYDLFASDKTDEISTKVDEILKWTFDK